MPSPSPQPDPKEAVEAQLCAYLEGDLTPAERAAIDQHLAAHPPHRQLMADLAVTRQWTRELPPASAPPEVGESFQGQVERSLLLGEDAAAVATRASAGGRWPQRALLAALVLLTLGLGVLVMLMLAPAGHRVAIDAPAGPPARRVLPPPPTPKAVDGSPEPSADVGPAPQAPPMAAPPASVGSLLPPTTVVPVTPTVPAPAAPAPPSFARLAEPPRTVHLSVVTGDPMAVGRFLARSGLTPAGTGSDDLAPAQKPRQQAGRSPDGGSRTSAGTVGAAPPPVGSALPVTRRYTVQGLTPAQVAQLTADLVTAAAPGRVTADPAVPSRSQSTGSSPLPAGRGRIDTAPHRPAAVAEPKTTASPTTRADAPAGPVTVIVDVNPR